MLRGLGEAAAVRAKGRVVNDETGPAGLAQHDKVVHVPMQDRRYAQGPQVVEFEP